jgi:prepilin peptidase CpaA
MQNLTFSSLLPMAVVLIFVVLVFKAAISDILTYLVPNRICLAIALLYPVYVLAAPAPVAWSAALFVAAVSLVIGFLFFIFGGWGGGDAKLFAAIALWAGPEQFLQLTLYTTLAGGVMAIFIWLQLRLAKVPVTGVLFQTDVDPDIGQHPMPYGAAIAVGALYVAFTLLKVG